MSIAFALRKLFMFINTKSIVLITTLLFAGLGAPSSSFADAAPDQSKNRIIGALQNIIDAAPQTAELTP
jgi:hypothetical protein